MQKQCRWCGEWKDEGEYHRKYGRLHAHCRDCHRKRYRPGSKPHQPKLRVPPEAVEASRVARELARIDPAKRALIEAAIPGLVWDRLLVRFWSRVDVREDGCWEWTASRMPTGYGHLNVNRKNFYTHRLAYTWARGPIPDGMHICHHCDNPPCVRPDHLFCGTHADNMRDRDLKGRGRQTKRVFSSALKAKIVEWYKSGMPVAEIKQRTKASYPQVKEIIDAAGVQRRPWMWQPRAVRELKRDRVLALRAAGFTLMQIAIATGIGETTVRRILSAKPKK